MSSNIKDIGESSCGLSGEAPNENIKNIGELIEVLEDLPSDGEILQFDGDVLTKATVTEISYYSLIQIENDQEKVVVQILDKNDLDKHCAWKIKKGISFRISGPHKSYIIGHNPQNRNQNL